MDSNVIRSIVSGLLVGLAGLIGGCQATSANPGHGHNQTDFSALERYFQSQLKPAGSLIESPPPAEPPAKQAVEFDIVAGPKADQRFAQEYASIDDQPGVYRHTSPTDKIEHLRFNDDGTVDLLAVEDTAHNVITRFETPLPAYRPSLKPGQTLTVTSQARVLNRDDLSQQTDGGKSVMKITWVGDQKLQTPAGSFHTMRWRYEYEGSFNAAHVTSTTVRWLSPTASLIATSYSEQVKALGLFGWDEQYSIVRRDAPAP